MPKHIVPVANMAGSAGKTTTTVSLAALLAERGRQVLVVDLDPQSNATEWLGHDPDEVEVSSATVLLKRAELAEALVETGIEGLFLLPAARRRMDAELIQLQGVPARDMRLKQALRDCPEGIDTVLIDCPGSMGVMTLAALVPATSVVTVTWPSGKELKGIPMLEDVIAELADAEVNVGLTLGAVVPCMVPTGSSAGSIYQDGMSFLTEAYGDRTAPVVRKSVRVPEAQSHGVPLPVYAPREGVTDDYRAVLAYLEEKGIL